MASAEIARQCGLKVWVGYKDRLRVNSDFDETIAYRKAYKWVKSFLTVVKEFMLKVCYVTSSEVICKLGWLLDVRTLKGHFTSPVEIVNCTLMFVLCFFVLKHKVWSDLTSTNCILNNLGGWLTRRTPQTSFTCQTKWEKTSWMT